MGGTIISRFRVIMAAWLTVSATLSAVVALPVPAQAAPTAIDRSGWSINTAQTTADDGNGPANAIDGSTGSFWHTQWQVPVPPFPHDLVINLGASHDIEGFRYLARQTGTNGEIKDYEIYLSNDGASWGSPVASGQLADTTVEQEVLFTATPGSWVRFRSLSSWHGDFTSISEFNLLSDGGGGTTPPDLVVTGVRDTTIDWSTGAGTSCSIVGGSGSPVGTELRAIVNGSCGVGTFNALGLDPGLYEFDFLRGATLFTVSVTLRDPVPMWDTAWSLPNRSSREQVDAYLDHMQAVGFAGTWISIAPFDWQGGMNDDNFYGDAFGSFSNPNEQYLAHVDYIIDEAALHGLGVGVVVAWGTDYTGLHPGTWPNPTTFGSATDRFEPCHPDPYSVIGASRAAALPANYFSPCDPADTADPRNEKAYDYGFLLGDRWKTKTNVRWVMGGDYWDGTSEPLTEHTWIKITDGLTDAGADQPVTYQPGGYQSSWDRFAADSWVDEVSFNHHCLEGMELEDVLAGLAAYGKPVIASEVRYEDEYAGWCPNATTIGPAEILADAQAILDSGADHYVYGHDKRWAWSQNDADGDGIVDAIDSLGDAGELAALGLLGANLPAATPSVPAPDPEARFAVIGDFGSNLPAEGDVAALVDSLAPDFIVTTGDNLYSAGGPGPVTFDNRVGQYYADYIGAYSGAYGSGSPTNRFFPSPGNHDYTDIGSASDLDEYEAYFTLPGAGIATTDTSGSERYYDFVQGPVHFFILDSPAILASGAETTAEAVWLQNGLAASIAPWQAVVLHHAPYSSSSAHGSNPLLQWPHAAWGADVVFAGHDHSLESLTVDGITYVVSGAGGRSLYGIMDPPLPESDFAYSADYGAVIVDACADGMVLEFHSVGGGELHTATIGAGCGPPTGPVDVWPPTWPVGSTITLTDVTLTSASLEWTAAVDDVAVTGYRLFDSADTLLETVIGSTTTTLFDLAPNTGYTVRVEAYDAAGNESQPLTGLSLGPRVDSPAGDRPHSVDIADIDGDGDNDLIVAAAGSDAAAVLLGTGSGTFQSVTLYPAGPGGEFPKNVGIADIDESGTLDLLTANQNTNRFGFLPGAGDGTFGPAATFETRTGAHDVVAADFNNDDNLDVAVVGWGDSMIATWFGDGTGGFAGRTDFEAGGSPHAVVAADFDDSGSIDLAIASHSLSAVRVLSGSGTGTFGSPANHPVSGSAHDVAVADFNSDGDEDLVTADESGDNVSVLLGSTGVGFAAAVSLPVGDQPKGVSVGDLNGDGAMDIVAASIRGNYPNLVNPGGDPLSVWLGNGDGTFTAGPAYTAGEAPFDVAVGDVNGDGHNDLVSANWHNDTVSVFLNLGAGGPATSFTTDTPFSVAPELSGLALPTAVEFAPDGRIFVAEKAGVLMAFNGFADPNPATVFDISAQVNDQLDRGFLGLAVHPDFPATPYVYGFYTSVEALPGTSGAVSSKLSRWEVDLSNSVVGGEQVLIHDWCQVYGSHSAGDLEFGPDGYLYATAGEGASFSFSDSGPDGCGDPPDEGGSIRSQDVLTSVGGEAADPVGLDGTVIRVDPLTGAAAPGNPLAGGLISGDDRIIAHGLRNPYRIAFHPVSGALYVGDVGSSSREEINRIAETGDALVENFGWPCWEGTLPNAGFTGVPLCDDLVADSGTWAVTTVPTTAHFEYSHQAALDGCNPAGSSVSALAFESDSNYPTAFADALFFTDYTRRCLFAMKAGAGGDPDPLQVELVLQNLAVVDMESGPGGDIFVLDVLAGTLSRVDFQGVNGVPAAVIAVDTIEGPIPLTVSFDGSGSTDPDGDPLTYQWDFDGDLIFDATGAMLSHTYVAPGTFAVHLRVTDPFGASNDALVTVSAGNTLPVPTIAEPLGPTTWAVGETIHFDGAAFDAEDGPLPPTDLDWVVRLHHCPDGVCHIHVETTYPGAASGDYVAIDHEYPSWLEFELTATDSTGASASTSVLVYPRTSTVRLETIPPGLDLVGGTNPNPQPTPVIVQAIEGGQITVNAPGPQSVGATEYDFQSWSDGQSRNHLVTVPVDDVTLTAEYAVSANHTIMAIGDSVTEGQDPNQSNPGDGWPTYRCFLWNALQAYSIDLAGSLTGTSAGAVGQHNVPSDGCPWAFDEDHEAYWGERTDEVAPKAAVAAAAATPDMALVHLGTNDVLQGQANAATKEEQRQLISDLRVANPAVAILLARPIPCDPAAGNPVFGTKCSSELPDLADRLVELAWEEDSAQSPVVIVDQHSNLDLDDLRDGVHPDTTGDAKMADAWFTGLEPLLDGIDPAGNVSVAGLAGSVVPWSPTTSSVAGRPLACAVVPGSGTGASAATVSSCTSAGFDATTLGAGVYSFMYSATDGGLTGNGRATHFGQVTVTLSAAGPQVEIFPGDTIQTIVDANPAGTEFLLRAGVYRMQQVAAKDNQVFTGEPGTILNGSRLLTGWIPDGGRWYVTGQTQQGVSRGSCDPGYERCVRPEDLFVDDVTYRHVTSLGALGPGSWYFDYGADRIYLGENPAGKTVETSVTPKAIFGAVDGVEIRNLVVEKYANPAQEGAIDSRAGHNGAIGLNWIVDGVEARLNHGSGIHVADGGIIRNSYTHHNAQQGFGAVGTTILVENTEIAFNNTARFNLDWEGGGNKLVGTNLTVRNNYTHDNHGPGIWVDIDSVDVSILDNVVERNFRAGIFFEVSDTATVSGNYAEGNGLDDPRAGAWLWASGILVASSGDADVFGNVVVNNGNGITATQQNRGTGRLVENLNVHDNIVTMAPDTVLPFTNGLTGVVRDNGDDAIFTSRNNHFQNNTYYADPGAEKFHWFNGPRTFAQWQSYGLDATGTISPITSAPPTWSGSLAATAATPTTIALTWSGASDPDGIGAYRVYEATLGQVATTAGATSATVRFLDPGTTYAFTVAAVDVMGNESTTGPSTGASTTGAGSTTPVVTIETPVDGAGFLVGGVIEFSASVVDNEAGLEPSVVWSSVPVGVSGVGESVIASSLTAGVYVVTAEVTDSDGLTGSDTVTVFVDEAGPLVWLPLDEGSGTAAGDASGNGNDGTLMGGAVFVADTNDGSATSVDFDGTDDWLDLGAVDVAGSGLTIAARFKADSFPGPSDDPRIVSKATGTADNDHVFMLSTIKVSSEVRLRGRVRVGGVTSTLTADSGDLVIGTWYHAALSYDGATLRLFLDGAEVGSVPLSGLVDQDPTVAVAGAAQSGGIDKLWDGLLDDIRIYERGLPPVEVAALAANTVPVAVNGAEATTVEVSLDVTLTGTDGDDDDLSFVVVDAPTNGSLGSIGPVDCAAVDVCTAVVTYVPDTAFAGSDSFTFRVLDEYGRSGLGTVSVDVVDIAGPVITLNPPNPMTLEAGIDTYAEPGATVVDDADPSPGLLIDASAVNESAPGSYQVTYTATDATGNSSQEIRTVDVLDTTPPVLTLIGNDPLTWPFGAPFVDSGASVSDNVDPSLTVFSADPVDVNSPGSYVLSYDYTDMAGNAARSVTRTVQVVVSLVPVDVVSVPDWDGVGSDEVGVLIEDPTSGASSVVLRDELTGSLTAVLSVPLEYQALDVEVTPAGGVAVLLRRVSDSQARVRVFESGSGSSIDFLFGTGDTVADLAVTPAGELAVLGERVSDGMIRVRVMEDPGGPGQALTYYLYGKLFTADVLQVTPAGALAVLGNRDTDGQVRVRVVDPAGVSGNYLYGKQFSGADLAVSTDGHLAVVGTRASDSLVRVQVIDPVIVGRINYFFGSDFTGDDVELSGGVDPAVLGTKYSNGQVRVKVTDAVTRVPIATHLVGSTYSGLDLEETTTGFGVLGQNPTGDIRVRINDTYDIAY